MYLFLIVAGLAYLLGSIPFGFLLVLLVRKQDIRAQGSGNIGATNVMRSGAKVLGLLTFLLDGSKGYAAVMVAEWLARNQPQPAPKRSGHSSRLVRGDGPYVSRVAALQRRQGRWRRRFGAFLALCWPAALSALGIWIVLVVLTRYVSLASILAAFSLPFLTLWLSPGRYGWVSGTAIFVCCWAVIVKHWQNIVRLANGKRTSLWQAGEKRSMSRIAIVGSGSWGTALALSLARRGDHSIALWSHSAAVAEAIRARRENLIYLPGFVIPPQVEPAASLAAAVTGAAIVISAVPSQHVRATYRDIAPFVEPGQTFVSATKGIEDKTFLRMTQVMEEVLGQACGSLSGPSFAQEVAAGAPTAVTVAFADSRVANRLQEELSAPGLRIYTNDDVVGVELGGALKNVIALAAGAASGLGLGHNSAAAIITRGVAEITRLAVACGGRRETLAGLSGLGDLVLTCTGPLSRNRSVGIELGRGRKLPEILAGLGGKVAEGVRTTSAALGLARLHGVEMPITEQMAAILEEGKTPQDAIRELMARPGRVE